MPVYAISRGIYAIGGPELSFPLDAFSYIIKLNRKYLVVDTGTGLGFSNILSNILELKVDIKDISYVIITHCHVDHAGGAYLFYKVGLPIVMHEKDALAVRTGDPKRTASDILNLTFNPSPVTLCLRSDTEISVDGKDITILHTPGHTPGSISVHLEVYGKKVVIIGDILGGLKKEWLSNSNDWRKSISKVLELDFDIILAGHFYRRGRSKDVFYDALRQGPLWMN